MSSKEPLYKNNRIGSSIFASDKKVLLNFVSTRSPWKIAISNDGSLLAVLEDNLLELFQREHFQVFENLLLLNIKIKVDMHL